MPRHLILFNLIFTLFLAGCSIGETPEKNTDTVKIGQLKSDSLILVNGLSEDFTVVHDMSGDPSVLRNVSMDPKDVFGTHPCESANHIEEFGDYFYVTCSLSNEIQVFENSELKITRIIDLGLNINPWSSIIRDNIGFVSSFLKDKVILFDPSPNQVDNRVLGEIDLSFLDLETDPGVTTRAYPQGMASVGKKIYVALTNLTQTSIGFLVSGGPGYVAVIDRDNLDTAPSLIKTSGRNTVSVYFKDQVYLNQYVFSLNAGTYDPNNGGYIGDGSIDQIEVSTGNVIRSINIGGAPFEMAASLTGIGYVSNGMEGKILKFNTVTGEVLEPIDLRRNKCNDFNLPRLTYISSIMVRGGKIFATDFNSNCLFVIEESTGKIVHQIKTGDGPDAMIFN